jgi:hypothetical protein
LIFDFTATAQDLSGLVVAGQELTKRRAFARTKLVFWGIAVHFLTGLRTGSGFAVPV